MISAGIKGGGVSPSLAAPAMACENVGLPTLSPKSGLVPYSMRHPTHVAGSPTVETSATRGRRGPQEEPEEPRRAGAGGAPACVAEAAGTVGCSPPAPAEWCYHCAVLRARVRRAITVWKEAYRSRDNAARNEARNEAPNAARNAAAASIHRSWRFTVRRRQGALSRRRVLHRRRHATERIQRWLRVWRQVRSASRAQGTDDVGAQGGTGKATVKATTEHNVEAHAATTLQTQWRRFSTI